MGHQHLWIVIAAFFLESRLDGVELVIGSERLVVRHHHSLCLYPLGQGEDGVVGAVTPALLIGVLLFGVHGVADENIDAL